MNLIIKDDYEQMSQYAAEILYDLLVSKEKMNIALTGGKTPIKTYEILAKMLGNQKIINKKIYNFDEIEYEDKSLKYGVTAEDLKKLILDKINLEENDFIHLNTKNYEDWNNIIEKNGGLDVVFMGLGTDGHFCGNLPGEVKFGYGIRLIKISDKQTKMLEESLEVKNKLSGEFVTIGPREVMDAKKLIMVVNGKSKINAMKMMISNEITENWPATILTLHNDFNLIATKDCFERNKDL